MAKIAISLPDEVLREIEAERQANGETRSGFVRRAVAAFLKQRREREWDQEYIRAYQEMPETEEEMGWVEAASQAVLAEYPWDDEAE